ncbi:MAG: YheC/YheD family protein [Paenibacillaceae bacterium]
MSFILIKEITSSVPIIRLHTKTAQTIGISHRKIVRICYGNRQDEVGVSMRDNIAENRIEMDQRIIDYLRIDISVRYDYQFHHERLIIGPLIGILFEYKDQGLKRRLEDKIERYVPYIKTIEEIGGLMYFFAKDQINYDKEEIKGYIYESKTSSWRSRILPFPGAIFHRTTISQKMKQKMGGKILNSYRLSKLDFWNMLKDHPKLNAYVPETTSEINMNKLERLLAKFGEVFLKHTKKGLGRSIFLISKKGNGYMVRENLEESASYMSKHQTEKFLHQHSVDYILQQAIQLKMHENRKIDYRVIVVKDLDSNWKCLGIIGWLGEINGITIHTLIEVNGKKVEDMLKLQFNYSPNEIKKKKNELTEIGLALASELDRQAGSYNDFGFDIGLDENGKLWIFEANVCQDLKCPLWINDYGMYEEIINHIIKYTKKIAMS